MIEREGGREGIVRKRDGGRQGGRERVSTGVRGRE